jgi:hypothetical protein
MIEIVLQGGNVLLTLVCLIFTVAVHLNVPIQIGHRFHDRSGSRLVLILALLVWVLYQFEKLVSPHQFAAPTSGWASIVSALCAITVTVNGLKQDPTGARAFRIAMIGVVLLALALLVWLLSR